MKHPLVCILLFELPNTLLVFPNKPSPSPSFINIDYFTHSKRHFRTKLLVAKPHTLVLSTFHSILVVDFLWTTFEVKMVLVCRILKHGRWAIPRESMGMNNPLDFCIITIEGRNAQENGMFNPSKKTFDKWMSLEIWVERLCDPLDGNDSRDEHLHKFSCQKCAKHNRLGTLHLEDVN